MNSTTMIQTEEELVAKMTEPSPAVTEAMARIKGDIMLLGVAGKMGPSLAELQEAAKKGTPNNEAVKKAIKHMLESGVIKK